MATKRKKPETTTPADAAAAEATSLDDAVRKFLPFFDLTVEKQTGYDDHMRYLKVAAASHGLTIVPQLENVFTDAFLASEVFTAATRNADPQYRLRHLRERASSLVYGLVKTGRPIARSDGARFVVLAEPKLDNLICLADAYEQDAETEAFTSWLRRVIQLAKSGSRRVD